MNNLTQTLLITTGLFDISAPQSFIMINNNTFSDMVIDRILTSDASYNVSNLWLYIHPL
jgi:hypothetical protein